MQHAGTNGGTSAAGGPADYVMSDRALWLAALRGDEAGLRSLLQQTPTLSSSDAMGSPPAFAAATADKLGALQLLLAAGARVDATNTAGRTSLHGAASMGSVRCVRHLLLSGAEVDRRDDFGATPLVLAALGGHAPCIKALLEHGPQNLVASDPPGCAFSVAQDAHASARNATDAARFEDCMRLLEAVDSLMSPEARARREAQHAAERAARVRAAQLERSQTMAKQEAAERMRLAQEKEEAARRDAEAREAQAAAVPIQSRYRGLRARREAKARAKARHEAERARRAAEERERLEEEADEARRTTAILADERRAKALFLRMLREEKEEAERAKAEANARLRARLAPPYRAVASVGIEEGAAAELARWRARPPPGSEEDAEDERPSRAQKPRTS